MILHSTFNLEERIKLRNSKPSKYGTVKLIHFGINGQGLYTQYTIEWDKEKEDIGEDWLERA
jgi:hypothetical protein